MPTGNVQLGPNLFYGDTPPNGANDGAVWINSQGQEQIFQNNRWRNLPAGYVGGTGSGGVVTQATDKSTGVTLNALSGQITMNGAALAAAAEAKFTVTDNLVAATDVPVVAIASAGTSGSYLVGVSAVGAGSFDVTVSNVSAGSLSEALVLNFVVLKGAST